MKFTCCELSVLPFVFVPSSKQLEALSVFDLQNLKSDTVKRSFLYKDINDQKRSAEMKSL